MIDRRMLIGGAWCEAEHGATFERRDPVTGALASRRSVSMTVRRPKRRFSKVTLSAPRAPPTPSARWPPRTRRFPRGPRSRRPSAAGAC
ncbi:vanillin dehydrogenase domain protein [Burkholderia pseudomallei]|nr:vanillin dehydrogenase domain protein [Burkholderia pseudomallei]